MYFNRNYNILLEVLMRKVELIMNKEYKYRIIKKLIETNENKKRLQLMNQYLVQKKYQKYKQNQ